jgi:hypothetical protein
MDEPEQTGLLEEVAGAGGVGAEITATVAVIGGHKVPSVTVTE